MPEMERAYYSPDNHLLIYTGPPPRRSCLTLELRHKWYHLHVVHPDGTTAQVPYDDYAVVEYSCQVSHLWADHVPYPPALAAIAKHLDMDWDENALDMAHGRYYREVLQLLDEEDPMDWINHSLVKEDASHAARRPRRLADRR
jgi:hypothetical protein